MAEMRFDKEFQEIGHCGGRFTVTVKTSDDGKRSVQFGVSSSRPVPSAWFGIYALPQGIPAGTIQLGGIGQPWNTPPTGDSISVFVGSDSHGLFGHQCRSCDGYWRSKSAPSRWRTTCPYCGVRLMAHDFLTDGQHRYVQAFCELVSDAIYGGDDGEFAIDMDAVADKTVEDAPKPAFYYSEESQQNKYTCGGCGDVNDILGRYGYCSCCGTYNGIQELESDLADIQDRIENDKQYERCVTTAVAAFDSFARQLTKQMVRRIPMTPRRQKEWSRKLFHNLERCTNDMADTFDIDLIKDMRKSDTDFAVLMFHRRHVYEHNGGEADEKYIADSGDTSVRVKQMLREDRDSAIRTVKLVGQLGRNLDKGFHELFPPEEGVPKNK